jgi:hypothetical protein
MSQALLPRFLGRADEVAFRYVRRFMRHPQLNTRAKRMGTVARVMPGGLKLWRLHAEQEGYLSWPSGS